MSLVIMLVNDNLLDKKVSETQYHVFNMFYVEMKLQ